MTPDRLKEIKTRCEAATGGEWSYSIDVVTGMPCTLFSVLEGNEIDIAVLEKWQGTGYDKEMLANAEFIAHARKDLPDCLRDIERLRWWLQKIRDRHLGDPEESWEMARKALEGNQER